jgi:aryl sulfotransferase
MDQPQPIWPRKRRELQTVRADSSVWNQFRFRNDDIVIATYEKAGTTWVQQIVAQLVFQGIEDIPLKATSIWLDMRWPPAAEKLATLERQQHRRFLKTHLPVDALLYSPTAKYLYVGRDGRDIAWSLFNHLRSYTDEYVALLNDVPGWEGPFLERPSGTAKEFFIDWMQRDGWPIGPFWNHVRGWWEIRSLPNLLLLHYARLKSDLPGQIRRIAAFLEIPIDGRRWPAIVERCGFRYMKTHAERFAPRGGSAFRHGARSFIYKGTNGRWRDMLSEEERAWYEDTARRELGMGCAAWLKTGETIFD